MKEGEIFKQLNKELDEWKTQTIRIVEGLKFRQKDVIEKIYRFYNSTYRDGEYDSEGYKKYFFNIVKSPCYVATKAIDFDTKDIHLLTPPGQNPIKTWLADRDLKYWMREKKFGEILNRVFYELPIFGTVVLKVVDDDIYFIDLRNFIVEQNSDYLRGSQYIIELHYYSPEELREMGKKLKWQNIEETIKTWRETKVPYIRIIERYGEVPEDWISDGGDPTKYVYSRIISYSEESKPAPERKYEVQTAGYILQAAPIDFDAEFPYWETHWEKLPGRWLGIGMVERLFDPQLRINEEMNLRVKSSYFSALNIFQTPDETINKNLLTDVKNGQIIISRAGITRVPTEERNLSAFETEHRLWLTNRDEITMTYDVIRGERLPAGTPLGSAMLASTMAGSYFDQIRENVALDIKDLLTDKIIPSFIKQNSEEHYLRLVGEDLERWHEWEINLEAEREKWRFFAQNGHLPTVFQWNLIKTAIKNKKKKEREKAIQIPKEYYSDLIYWLEIEITGEATDIRIKAANLQMALQAITVDPTLLTDPTKRKIFAQILEMGGIRIEDLELLKETEEEKVSTITSLRGAGGGVSAPNFPLTPIAGANETKI